MRPRQQFLFLYLSVEKIQYRRFEKFEGDVENGNFPDLPNFRKLSLRCILREGNYLGLLKVSGDLTLLNHFIEEDADFLLYFAPDSLLA